MEAKRVAVTRTHSAAMDPRPLVLLVAMAVQPVERVAVLAVLEILRERAAASAQQAQHRVAVAVAATRQALPTTVAVVERLRRVGSCSRIRQQQQATGDGEYS